MCQAFKKCVPSRGRETQTRLKRRSVPVLPAAYSSQRYDDFSAVESLLRRIVVSGSHNIHVSLHSRNSCSFCCSCLVFLCRLFLVAVYSCNRPLRSRSFPPTLDVTQGEMFPLIQELLENTRLIVSFFENSSRLDSGVSSRMLFRIRTSFGQTLSMPFNH